MHLHLHGHPTVWALQPTCTGCGARAKAGQGLCGWTMGTRALTASCLFWGDFLICLWPDPQVADLGARVQQAAFGTPTFSLSLAKRQVTGRGVSFPTLPGWQPRDLGHQCSNPTLCLLKARVPVGFFICVNACGRISMLAPFLISTFGFP